MSDHITYYYVGPDRIKASTLVDALQVAVTLMPDRRLGDCVNIYMSLRPNAQVRGRLKVLIEPKSGKLRYVYFRDSSKYGHTIRKDYTLDIKSRWCNAAFRSGPEAAQTSVAIPVSLRLRDWCMVQDRRRSVRRTSNIGSDSRPMYYISELNDMHEPIMEAVKNNLRSLAYIAISLILYGVARAIDSAPTDEGASVLMIMALITLVGASLIPHHRKIERLEEEVRRLQAEVDELTRKM